MNGKLIKACESAKAGGEKGVCFLKSHLISESQMEKSKTNVAVGMFESLFAQMLDERRRACVILYKT